MCVEHVLLRVSVLHLQALLSFSSFSFEGFEILRGKLQQKSTLHGGKSRSGTEGICSVEL